jgi:hypothetical protein
MEQLVNLGSTAVLDADQISIGQFTEIDGQLLVVEKIEGINVYFRPVTGWKSWKYRWEKASLIVKLTIFSAVIVVGALLFLGIMSIGEHSHGIWY